MYASIAHYPEPVQEFLKSDRQWPRRLRIKHAAQCLKNAVCSTDHVFWEMVLEANEGKAV